MNDQSGTPNSISTAMRFCPMCELRVPAASPECPECHGPLMISDPDDLTGKVIDGRYTVLSRLGKGGMGVVYKARQRFLERDVALKVLRSEMAADTLAVRRFLQEAKAASGLRNPHTVTIFEFGSTVEGTLYFTMELLSGRSLRDVIAEQGALSPARVVELGAQVCDSLAEAHELGIWHRDLKPDNIYLVENPQESDFAKVLDFGIAKVSTQQTQLTSTGAICGTPQYMSPEQAKGIPLDGRSDIYSLGIVLYETLCGRAPFDATTPIQMLMAHITQDPPVPRVRRPGLSVPARLEEVVMWALAKEPGDRPSSAREFARELRSSLGAGANTVDMKQLAEPSSQPAGLAAAPGMPASSGLAGEGQKVTASGNAETSLAITHPRVGVVLPGEKKRGKVNQHSVEPEDFSDEDLPKHGHPWRKMGALGLALMVVAGGLLIWRPWVSTVLDSAQEVAANSDASRAENSLLEGMPVEPDGGKFDVKVGAATDAIGVAQVDLKSSKEAATGSKPDATTSVSSSKPNQVTGRAPSVATPTTPTAPAVSVVPLPVTPQPPTDPLATQAPKVPDSQAIVVVSLPPAGNGNKTPAGSGGNKGTMPASNKGKTPKGPENLDQKGKEGGQVVEKDPGSDFVRIREPATTVTKPDDEFVPIKNPQK